MAVRRARRARRAPDRHFLRPALAAAIVADACVAQDELVLDIGAGTGRLTAELEATGARVVAVELDPAHAATLRRRFRPARVTIVEGDVLATQLPREPFRVVANLPFGRTTSILRRLFDDPRVPLTRADVIVEWDVARKRTACWPSTLLGVCWSVWYELTLVRRIPRGGFEPPPSVDAGVLRAAGRTTPLVSVPDAAAFRAFVRRGFQDGLPRTPAAKKRARALGLHGPLRPRELDAYQWAALFDAVRGSGYSSRGRRPL